MKAKSFDAFDFLIVFIMNVGNFGKRGVEQGCRAGGRPPEFLTLPASVLRIGHRVDGSWEKFYTYDMGLDLDLYSGERGFEQIAEMLLIPYPERAVRSST